MLRLLELFWLIARRKLGPEDVPSSRFLLKLTVCAYMVLQVPLLWRQGGITPAAGVSILADVVIVFLFVWVLLWVTGNVSRYQQTMIAFFGTGFLVTLLALPITYFYLSIDKANELLVLPFLALIGILIWSIIINAHIFSRAISRSLFEGVAIALLYFIINFQLLEAIPK